MAKVQLNENHLNSSRPGLVISYFGNSVAVEAENGQVFQCHLHRNQALPVVGDIVQWQLSQGETGVVTEIMPRKSLLARGDHHGSMKPLAANIDAVAMVMSPAPIFSEYLLDRYLVAAELLHIAPVIVLHKIDLLDDVDFEAAQDRLKPYQKIPYPVILSSVYREKGLDELSQYFNNKNAVLIGPSGVGKSSIIASLTKELIHVGDTTAKGGGKHTTTTTRLYHLANGGSLIDSPGVREFNLWPVTQQEVLDGFKEFQDFIHQCKFRNCKHLAEPGCSVKAAVAEGKISARRFESYQTLMGKTVRT